MVIENIPVIVTAKTVTVKTLNLVIASLQDFGPGNPPTTVEEVNKETLYAVVGSADPLSEGHELHTTMLPVTNFETGFADWDLAQVADWILTNESKLEGKVDDLYVVIDEQSLEDKRAVVIEKKFVGEGTDEYMDEEWGENPTGKDITEDKDSPATKFRFCRIPYEEAYTILMNLSIANMDFAELVGALGVVKSGWVYEWKPFPDSTSADAHARHAELQKEAGDRLDAVLKELREGGHIN